MMDRPRKVVVSNSTPLIYLAKIGRLTSSEMFSEDSSTFRKIIGLSIETMVGVVIRIHRFQMGLGTSMYKCGQPIRCVPEICGALFLMRWGLPEEVERLKTPSIKG